MARAERRQVFRQHFADHRPAGLRDRALRRLRHRGRARRRARRQGRVGPHQPGRAGANPQQDRRPHGGESRDAGDRRNLGQRQADPRDDGRRPPAGGRSFPLFRRRDPRTRRVAQRDRPRHCRLSFPRAARRGRPDHSLELPDPDGRLEARAGARGRQLRRPQARRADPGLDHGADGAGRRPVAEGRPQCRQRLRPGSGQAARLEQPHRQDRLYRRDDDGPAHHAIRLAEPDPGHARARRQVAQHLLRGRVRRGRRLLRQGDRRLRHVRAQPGRGLHLPEPRADPGVDLRPLHGTRAEARRRDRPGQPARSRDDDRRAGLVRADWRRSSPTSTSASRRAPRS